MFFHFDLPRILITTQIFFYFIKVSINRWNQLSQNRKELAKSNDLQALPHTLPLHSAFLRRCYIFLLPFKDSLASLQNHFSTRRQKSSANNEYLRGGPTAPVCWIQSCLKKRKEKEIFYQCLSHCLTLLMSERRLGAWGRFTHKSCIVQDVSYKPFYLIDLFRTLGSKNQTFDINSRMTDSQSTPR